MTSYFRQLFTNLCRTPKGVEKEENTDIIARNTIISPNFHKIRPKQCRNCAFPQNFHTNKLDETTVFYAVYEMD